MLRQKLQGSFVAIVTPFDEQSHLDVVAFRKLLRWHLASGTNGIVVCGTTGENATLTRDERETVIRLALQECSGKIPVIAGIASNHTADAVEQISWLKNMAVDAALVLSPYYNKPPNEGLFQHFKAVAEVGLPVIVYNVPGRTGSNVPPDVVTRLAKEVPGMVGVKEASGNPAQIMEILSQAPDDFSVLLGDDNLTIPMMALGASGCISVIANEMPKAFALMMEAALRGDFKAASLLHFQMLPLMNANFMETNPLPVKTALSLMGKVLPVFRLPLVPMLDANVQKLGKILQLLHLTP